MRVFLSRTLDLVFRRRRDDRLNAEVQSHLDHMTDDYIRKGLSAADARLAARRAFGGVDQVKEVYRDQRGLPFVDGLVQDVRYAARILTKDRSFTAAAVLVLALGIGVNTTVFTIINGMNLSRLPVERGDQIMSIASQEVKGRRQEMGVSYADLLDWRAATKTFSSLAGYTRGTFNVGDADRPADRLAGSYISTNAFGILRERPILGRDFSPDDDRPGAAPVAILSHGTWSERYGANPSIVGRVIRLSGTPTTVIGVMRPGFRFPVLIDLWQPIGQFPGLSSQQRNQRTFGVFGRLRDDASLVQARAELATITAALAARYPATNDAVGATVVPFTQHYMGTMTDQEPMVLMAAACFVLLIACANAANLLLARSAHRAREIALRVAIGAGRSRIIRQLLVESVMLAMAAGVVGLLLAVGGMRLFSAETVDLNLPYWVSFGFDARVFSYLAIVCLGTAVAFGLAPAWQLSQTNAHDVLKEGGRSAAGGRRTRRWTSGLMVGELALTVVLLAGAGLLIRSAMALYDADSLLDDPTLVVARLSLPEAKFATADERRTFYGRLQARLDAVPTIASATVGSTLPFIDGALRRLVREEDDAIGESRTAQTVTVGDRYFETLALRMLRGRALTPDDGLPGREAVVVNERLATLHFAGLDPIGRRIRLMDPRATAATGPWFTIVGVSPSVRQRPMSDVAAVAYLPWLAESGPTLGIVLRHRADIAAVNTALRTEVRALDHDVAIYNLMPLARLSELSRWGARIAGTLLTVFAGIAMLLSAMGLYAVTAYGVAQRTSEIGIRIALGAHRTQVSWLFLKGTLWHVGLGLAIGLAGAVAVGQLIRGLLVRTSAVDLTTFVTAVVALVVVALVACLVPARRAARLDPVAALRHD